MMEKEEKENAAGRIAGGIFSVIVLVVAGVAIFRRKRSLAVTDQRSSEEWEDCLGI